MISKTDSIHFVYSTEYIRVKVYLAGPRQRLKLGVFHGAALPDPARLLQGAGKFMRHVKLKLGTDTNAAALSRLIDAAYSDIKARVENG
jgi:hypothetical protein